MTRLFRASFWIAPLILMQFCFLAFYLGQEKAVQFWDYAMYANMALDWFGRDGGARWALFAQSFDQKYNLLFAVPSTIGFALFAPTRNVFILTNFVAFFVPFQLAVAFVLKQVFGQAWPRTLLTAFVLCVLVPFAWYPLVQGYPDHGAAACFTLAVGLCLRGDRAGWKTALASGALMGLAILLRRHYAYPVVALLATSGAFELGRLFQAGHKQRLALIKNKVLYYFAMALGLLGVLVVCEPAYLKEILTTRYATLYKSYERPPAYFMLFALSRAGLALFVAAVMGYGHCLLNQQRQPNGMPACAGMTHLSVSGLFFVSSLFVVWFALWSFGPAQAGEHYLISVMPLFCVVGLAGLVQLWCVGPRTRAVWALVFFVLALNSGRALWGADFVLPTNDPSLSFFSTPRPPWVRGDLPELRRLAQYVAQMTTDKDKIVVVGSSFVFNQDLVRALYTDELKNIPPAFRFVQAPESDGEQDPPLDAYALATVFLVATPTQYHLPPEGQRVIGSLAALFPPSPDVAAPFKKDAETFALMDGVTVEVWRRTDPFAPAALHAQLSRIRAVKDMPRLWIAQKSTGQIQPLRDPQGPARFIVRHGGQEGLSSLFYDAPLPLGRYRLAVDLQVEEACEEVRLTALMQTAAGSVLSREEIPVYQKEGTVFLPFDSEQAQNFLTLEVKTKGPSLCTVALWQLQLQQKP